MVVWIHGGGFYMVGLHLSSNHNYSDY
jgi:hypothetical protein